MADPANECFALRREDGSLTGEIKPRALVHRDGDLHGASHVFLARLRGGRAELLLQRRTRSRVCMIFRRPGILTPARTLRRRPAVSWPRSWA